LGKKQKKPRGDGKYVGGGIRKWGGCGRYYAIFRTSQEGKKSLIGSKGIGKSRNIQLTCPQKNTMGEAQRY